MVTADEFPQKVDKLWVNANLATMRPENPYGKIENGALATQGQTIAWAGPVSSLPPDAADRAAEVIDLAGAWVTPGLVDCHTHLVYAGNRAHEFELRLKGASYEDIARQGGGILSTVAATRRADQEELVGQSARRLAYLLAEGVTTIEIKSGYGLDLETELKQLRVARILGERFPVTVCPTYLGAHALPPEYAGQSDAYIDFICETVLPKVARENLALAVDAFCETIAFSREQTERFFRAAAGHGLKVKLHAEQLSDQQGAALAAKYGALSADHLENVSAQGVKAMARAGTVAVLLPGAFYFLRETRLPPIDLFREHKVPMAVSTDCNPGTSPTVSLILMLNMACTLFGLTPEEALAGVTQNAAQALGLGQRIGTLEPGKDADLVVWDIAEPAELAYGLGHNPCRLVVRRGVTVTG